MPPVAKKSKPIQQEARTIVWPFGRKNYLLFAVALVVISIGYVLLGQGSMTLAPLLLVVGYCALVPWAILAKDKSKYPTGDALNNNETAR